MEQYYEHPKGYRPNKKKLVNGVFITGMEPGQKFTASDGRKFQVIKVKKTRCSGSNRLWSGPGGEVFECDMWAKCIATGEIFVFHHPVDGNPWRFTYIIEKEPAGNVAIAIDGPAGAGKTTQAKLLAQELGFTYVDTGALYRALAVHKIRRDSAKYIVTDEYAEISDEEISELLTTARIEFKSDPKNGQRVYLNSEDITNSLRTPKASMLASTLSANPAVREFLLSMQREIASKTSVVMEGRDIGTVVLPDADVKFFLTADVLVRAYRRKKELVQAGTEVNEIRLVSDIVHRDFQDSTRETAPLKKAPGAIEIDCSELSIKQTTDAMLSCIKLN